MTYRTEEEMASDVTRWLADQGWDVFEEVTLHGNRADIVAVRGSMVWVVECKLSFGLDVIAQASHWIHWANLVSVAVRSARHSDARVLAQRICKDRGIGVIEVSPLDREFDWCVGRWGTVPPRLNRRAGAELRATLGDGHKRYRAGNSANEYHTPWRETCESLVRLLNANPNGLTVREIVTHLKHHYASDASARGSLVAQTRSGLIRGVRLDTTKRPYRFFPEVNDG